MKAILMRTGSVPALTASLKISISGQDSVSGIVFSSGDKSGVASPKVSLHLQINISTKRTNVSGKGIRRAMSESDVVQAGNQVSRRSSSFTGAGSRSFLSKIPEEEYLYDNGALNLGEGVNCAGIWPVEEVGFTGDGIGKGKGKRTISGGGGGRGGSGGDTSTGSNEDRRKIGAYYQEMLKSNPGDSLLLRNYAKFLHKVKKDTARAEDYYGRAILANPGDGEVLSSYRKLIWETQRDETRAKSYFDQAIFAYPNDCTVFGSYANFMWEADEDDEEEEIKREAAEADEDDEEEEIKREAATATTTEIPSAMVAAF